MGWAIKRKDGKVVRFGCVESPEALGPMAADETAEPWDGEAVLDTVPPVRRYAITEEAILALAAARSQEDLEAAQAKIIGEVP